MGQVVKAQDGNESEGLRKTEEERLARIEKEQEEIHEKNQKLFAQAVEAAKDADAVIFVGGLNHNIDSEGFDRIDMKLPYEQDILIEELLKVRKDTILTFVGGSPVEMPTGFDDFSPLADRDYSDVPETAAANARLLESAITVSTLGELKMLAERFSQEEL